MYLKLLKDSFSEHGSLHHACLIQGDKDVVLDSLISFFEDDLKFNTRGNPDFHFMEFSSFGIDDGRTMQGRASQKALFGRKIFVATFNTMTHEAQNALLKLFEEPTPDTHFFLITPNAEKLLRTLRSRMFFLADKTDLADDVKNTAQSFLKSNPKERLIYVKNIIESKDKALAAKFIDSIEGSLYKGLKGDKDSKEFLKSLSTIEDAKMYVEDKGSSLKLLLEHLSLTLPKV